ncbi:AAA family ATPase [Methanococcus sp. CF]
MKLIGITGMPGSGKSAITKLAEKYKITVVSMGDVVRHETSKQGLTLNPENVGNTAVKLREIHGKEAIAVPCLKYVNEKYNCEDFVIIEGIRSIYEVNYLKKHAELDIIAIHASPKTRFERLSGRNREDDSNDWNTFVERDERELNFSIGNVISLSDYMVVNEGSYDDFISALEKTFKKVITTD